MSQLIAYDAARWRFIPASAQAIFPYADGKFHWSHRDLPRARWRTITVLGDPDCDIADVEPGCIWPPANAGIWAERRLGRGNRDLTVYCDRDIFPEVATVMERFTWHLFLATLDGTILTEFGGKPLRACQYTDHSNLYDESLVYEPEWLLPPVAA